MDASYRHRIKKYGLTIDEYEQMIKEQNNCCYICGDPPEKSKGFKRLVIDHCHDTNKVRRVLCNSCNIALGSAKDDTIILQKMIDYLNEFNFKDKKECLD